MHFSQIDLWNFVATYGGYFAAGVAMVVAVMVLRRMAGHRGKKSLPPASLLIDVAKFEDPWPPPAGPVIELYHLPVRLAVLVLAPAGRVSLVPDEVEVPALLDQVVPGMKSVVENHRPWGRKWPPQLSIQGFANSLFSQIQNTGGESGHPLAGTRWSAIAGRIDCGERKLLLGIVVCAAEPNGIGGVLLNDEREWLDVLRIRSPTP